MVWRLRKVDRQWECWDENEKIELNLRFLPFRTSVPSFFPTWEELEKWLNDEEKKQAKNKALQLLARQSYSSHSLRQKLMMKGFSARVSQEIVEWARQLGYVDDIEYLRSAIRREQKSNHGFKAIVWKLHAKGFSQEAIEREIKQCLPVDAEQEAIAKIISKMQSSSRPSNRQKIIAALLRRGFSIDAIKNQLSLDSVEME